MTASTIVQAVRPSPSKVEAGLTRTVTNEPSDSTLSTEAGGVAANRGTPPT
jgi:hypothetical protein